MFLLDKTVKVDRAPEGISLIRSSHAILYRVPRRDLGWKYPLEHKGPKTRQAKC